MAELTWHKSSHSEKLDCIEVALLPAHTLIRDSKNPDTAHLAIPKQHWHTFLSGLKNTTTPR